MQYETSETTGRKGFLQAESLWLRVFPNPSKLKKKYPWFYESTSYLSNLYLLRVLGINDVVGAVSYVSRAYNSINGEKVVGLCADFAIDEKHRTLVPALQLLKELIKGSSDKCDILLGFPNNKSALVMRRSGFHVLGELPRYALILKSGPYIKKTPLSCLSSLIAVPIDQLIKLYFWMTQCKKFYIYELTEIFSADESFDNLWSVYCEKSHLFVGKRDRSYLNWRFFSNPNTNYHVFALRNIKTRELIGYAVVRVDVDGHWHLFDFFTLFGSEYLKCLIQKLIARAIKKNATSLSLEFLGNQVVPKLLHRLKFSRRLSERRVVLHFLKYLNDTQGNCCDVNNWYITSADELG